MSGEGDTVTLVCMLDHLFLECGHQELRAVHLAALALLMDEVSHRVAVHGVQGRIDLVENVEGRRVCALRTPNRDKQGRGTRKVNAIT